MKHARKKNGVAKMHLVMLYDEQCRAKIAGGAVELRNKKKKPKQNFVCSAKESKRMCLP